MLYQRLLNISTDFHKAVDNYINTLWAKKIAAKKPVDKSKSFKKLSTKYRQANALFVDKILDFILNYFLIGGLIYSVGMILC